MHKNKLHLIYMSSSFRSCSQWQTKGIWRIYNY